MLDRMHLHQADSQEQSLQCNGTVQRDQQSLVCSTPGAGGDLRNKSSHYQLVMPEELEWEVAMDWSIAPIHPLIIA
jgi:hypothetical protein